MLVGEVSFKMEARTSRVSVFLSALFGASLFLFHSGVAIADPMQGGPIEFYLTNQKQLGLSPDQVSKLQAISTKFQKLRVIENGRIKVIQKEGMQLLIQKDINTVALEKDIDRVLKHKKILMTARVEMLVDAHKVLTDEQFSRLKKLLEQMMMHQEVKPVAH